MTKVKICGLRRLEDIEAVNRWKPDYVGFVFAPSKRRVSMQEAAVLSCKLQAGICPVGVFVDADVAEIAEAVSRKIIGMIQLHGHETVEQIRHLRSQIPATVPIIKAIGMVPGKEQEIRYWQQEENEYLLLDAARAGSGAVFDHTLIENNRPILKPWFLAGGISEDNVVSLIRRFSPYGVDVSSGVETDGYKDPGKIEAIIRRVRNE
ncbi:MAG: phosphoribosylanthranilate isomerase [Lachnospiraceae bacterium]